MTLAHCGTLREDTVRLPGATPFSVAPGDRSVNLRLHNVFGLIDLNIDSPALLQVIAAVLGIGPDGLDGYRP